MSEKYELLELKFGTYKLYADHIVGVPAEGVVIKRRQVRELMETVRERYSTPFVYIGDRVAVSSVDLSIYPFLEMECTGKLLRGIGIVAHRDITELLAQTEKSLAGKLPFKVFHSLKEAREWVGDILSP